MAEDTVEPIGVRNIHGCRALDEVFLQCGRSRWRGVPLYDVKTLHGLNKLIGYIVFMYQDYKVLYRGTPQFYPNVLPSLFRICNSEKSQDHQWKNERELINRIRTDTELRVSMNLNDYEGTKSVRDTFEDILVGSILQHYGVATQNLDAVDNHWTALWFGLHIYTEKETESGICAHYIRRSMGASYDVQSRFAEDGYQYIYVMAIRNQLQFQKSDQVARTTEDGNVRYKMIPSVEAEEKKTYAVDLRRIVPSTFLRPAAQHGWMIASTRHKFDERNDYANHVVCVLRLKVADVNHWMGTGEMITQQNLFPDPLHDQGYDILLAKHDVFQGKDYRMKIRLMV